MNIPAHDKYFFSLGENDEVVNSLLEVKNNITNAQSLVKGSISVCADDGPRPWLDRIFGLKRYIRSYFRIEWDSEFAGLIFHDENDSEYRSIDEKHKTSASEDIRKKISFGEYEPLPSDHCLEKDRAFAAIIEFIETGKRPEWLEYIFVK